LFAASLFIGMLLLLEIGRRAPLPSRQ